MKTTYIADDAGEAVAMVREERRGLHVAYLGTNPLNDGVGEFVTFDAAQRAIEKQLKAVAASEAEGRRQARKPWWQL